MILCKDCKWWENTSSYNDKFKNFKGCANPKFLYGYGIREEDVDDDSVVIVENDEGWGAFMGANFGCVHGERKEPL